MKPCSVVEEPNWREVEKASSYVIGQYVFNYLRAFLGAAGIDASDCKLTITLPTDSARKLLTRKLQEDAHSAPARSAARIGNSSGFWQGIEYEFVSKVSVGGLTREAGVR